MLREGRTYLEIAEKTGASTATISRVNRSLNYGNDGYDMVFKRLEDRRGSPERPQLQTKWRDKCNAPFHGNRFRRELFP